MSKSISYYRESGSECNVAIDDRTLVVNCAGQVVADAPFVSDRPFGRMDYYLIALTRGKMNIRLDGRDEIISEGECVILPPNAPHYYTFAGGELIYYWTHFTGGSALSAVTRAGLEINRRMSIGRDEMLTARFHGLFDTFILADDWQESEAAGRLLLLLAALGRAAVGKPAKPSLEPIRRSLRFMETNYGDQITVTELAAMEFMSVSRYSALFRGCTGIAPKEYLTRIRMRSAIEMLTRTDMSVGQIARAVGYDDPLYFSRIFKKYMGYSPKAARER